MRVIISLTFLIFATPECHGGWEKAKLKFALGKNDQVSAELVREKMYYSASVFAKRHMIKVDKVSEYYRKVLQKILVRTTLDVFSDLPTRELRKFDIPVTHITLGKRYFSEKKYKKAIEHLSKIKKGHRLFPEISLYKGTSFNILERDGEAEATYQECMEASEKRRDKAKNQKFKRYYQIINELCTINIARMAYRRGDYNMSIQYYDQIDKRSYRWPYTLMEKAWAHYNLKDYNRTLGILVTYRSPLMKSYFFPEAETLTALSYHDLCLYDDSLSTIEQYYEVYKKRSDSLLSIINGLKNKKDGFIELIKNSNKGLKERNPFVSNLVTQVKKQVKFNLSLVSLTRMEKEMKALEKRENGPLKEILLRNLKEDHKYLKNHLNLYAKKHFYDFVNEIHRLSYEMFSIKLEILSQKKNLVYDNKKLIAERSRGDHSNVNRKSNQYFWTFKGSFWADELGDYSFGLKSNCETIKAGAKI